MNCIRKYASTRTLPLKLIFDFFFKLVLLYFNNNIYAKYALYRGYIIVDTVTDTVTENR